MTNYNTTRIYFVSGKLDDRVLLSCSILFKFPLEEPKGVEQDKKKKNLLKTQPLRYKLLS
jgi:hypothetical protein